MGRLDHLKVSIMPPGISPTEFCPLCEGAIEHRKCSKCGHEFPGHSFRYISKPRKPRRRVITFHLPRVDEVNPNHIAKAHRKGVRHREEYPRILADQRAFVQEKQLRHVIHERERGEILRDRSENPDGGPVGLPETNGRPDT